MLDGCSTSRAVMILRKIITHNVDYRFRFRGTVVSMNPNVRIPIIDADTHLTETPDLWSKRLPLKFRGHGPRVDKHPESGLMRWRLGDRWTSGEASFARIPGYQDEITFPNTWSE